MKTLELNNALFISKRSDAQYLLPPFCCAIFRVNVGRTQSLMHLANSQFLLLKIIILKISISLLQASNCKYIE